MQVSDADRENTGGTRHRFRQNRKSPASFLHCMRRCRCTGRFPSEQKKPPCRDRQAALHGGCFALLLSLRVLPCLQIVEYAGRVSGQALQGSFFLISGDHRHQKTKNRRPCKKLMLLHDCSFRFPCVIFSVLFSVCCFQCTVTFVIRATGSPSVSM